MRLTVAGITTEVVCDDPSLRLSLAGPARRFVVPDAEPEVTVRVGLGELRQECDGEPIFDSGAVWQLYRQEDRFLFRFRSPAFGPLPYKTACFNPSFSAGEVCLHRPYFEARGPVYPLEYPLDELLIINRLAAQGQGVEIHACGVIDRSGAGYLFAGQSGAGKTTMARVWRQHAGVTILSDDRVVLRRDGDHTLMYGTPWHGDEPLVSPAGVRLARIFFLRQGRRLELTPLGRADAVARLVASSFPPFYSAAGLDFTLGLLDEVTRSVPCHELSFPPDSTAVDFVRRQI